jgi:hypothetical protein
MEVHHTGCATDTGDPVKALQCSLPFFSTPLNALLTVLVPI